MQSCTRFNICVAYNQYYMLAADGLCLLRPLASALREDAAWVQDVVNIDMLQTALHHSAAACHYVVPLCPALDNIQVMVIVWRLRGILSEQLCAGLCDTVFTVCSTLV